MSGLSAVFSLWRNVRVQRFAFQLLFALIVLVIAWVLLTNLNRELSVRNLEAFPFVDLSFGFPFIDLSQDFLKQRAGFGIQETSFGSEYSANDSYGDAYVIGLLNTVRVAVAGIALATILGVFAGIARLSTNWLVSRVATLYVEIFRNVPLAVQLIFWYTVLFLRLPKIQDAPRPGGIAVISNRAIAFPWAEANAGFGFWLLLLFTGAVVALLIRAWRARREDATGSPSHPWWWAFATFLLIAIAGFFLTGGALDFTRPTIDERRVIGGLSFSPEFMALLVGLVVYTGTFIAEIVRGSILAIARGQSEAAAALGLTTAQRLRFVILPQAMRIIIPPLTNQYLNLTKNSSLAVFVAFPDVFKVASISINQTGQAVPLIILVMLTYLAMSLLTAFVMNLINQRLQVAPR